MRGSRAFLLRSLFPTIRSLSPFFEADRNGSEVARVVFFFASQSLQTIAVDSTNWGLAGVGRATELTARARSEPPLGHRPAPTPQKIMGKPKLSARDGSERNESHSTLAVPHDRGTSWTQIFWSLLSRRTWTNLFWSLGAKREGKKGTNRGIIKRAKHERHLKYRIYSKSAAASSSASPAPDRIAEAALGGSGAHIAAATADSMVTNNLEEWKESVKQEILTKLRSELASHQTKLLPDSSSAITVPYDAEVIMNELPKSMPPPPPPLPPVGFSMPSRFATASSSDASGTWVSRFVMDWT